MEEDNKERKINARETHTMNVPSFLSPVGETSMNYSVIMDDDEDDDIMGMSPITPSMSYHPPLHTESTNYSHSRNSRTHSNGNGRSHNYEASYGIEDDDQYIYSVPNNDGDNDLPTPLLRYTNANGADDDDDDRYQQSRPYLLDNDHDHLRNATPKLNGLNYLNAITYVLNVFTSYFVGVRGLFGVLPTRRDVFIEYETLVTPANYAYWLWAPILVFEFFFATAQLLPQYRARPIIQQGTGLYFFWACIIQTIWTVFFAMRWFISSFVAVVLALLCMVCCLASQHYNVICAPTARGRGGMSLVALLSMATMAPPRRRRKSLLEYWFFRFPFYLHCGWLLVCMVVQFSMVFRYRFTDSTGAQMAADIVALGVMLPPATFFLTGQSSGPDFVIPAVILWSYVSIGVELHTPSDMLVHLYGHPAIIAVQNASYVFTGLIGVMLVPRIIIWAIQEYCTIDVVELENEDDDDDFGNAINEVRFGTINGGVVNDGDSDSDVYNAYNGGNDEENLGSNGRDVENGQVTPEETTSNINISNNQDDEEEDDDFQDCHESEDSTNGE